MATATFGSGIRRREDPRLITGAATYTDDFTAPGMVHAAMLRSPHAHARITKIDTTRARQAPGVVAVFTGADVEGVLQPVPCAWLLPNADLKVAAYPAIAKDTVRYVGDIVATVVAETASQAYDALELIEVDYEPLPSVTSPLTRTSGGRRRTRSRAMTDPRLCPTRTMSPAGGSWFMTRLSTRARALRSLSR